MLAGDTADGKTTVRVHARPRDRSPRCGGLRRGGARQRAPGAGDRGRGEAGRAPRRRDPRRPGRPRPQRLRQGAPRALARQLEPRRRRRRRSAARMKQFLQIALGILSAIGGFVDIGDLVFNTPGRRDVRLRAAVGRRRRRRRDHRLLGDVRPRRRDLEPPRLRPRPRALGFSAGLGTLIASEIVNLMTLRGRGRRRRDRAAAPLGPALPPPDPGRASSGCSSPRGSLPFEWIERIFGYVGLCLLVFAVAAVKVASGLGRTSRTGFVPQRARRRTGSSTSTSSSACSGRR